MLATSYSLLRQEAIAHGTGDVVRAGVVAVDPA
jgi:hypothetical protein